MHYKNGREAKAGDIAVSLTNKTAGLLHSVSASSNTCNGRLAPINGSDPYVTISECLHIDDVAAATIPDCTK